MNIPEPPKFEWGQRVSAVDDLYNDGSFPDQPADVLLVKAGDAGEIVQIGTHTETGTHIYLVEFGERLVVGCLEGELCASSAKCDSAAEESNAI
jgi:nitrogen fixation protein NifZ